MSEVLLDTHVLLWLTADPGQLSRRANQAIEAADELAVVDITWWELAWLEAKGRVVTAKARESWLADLSRVVRTLPVTPAVALTAARLPATFPGDPADRLIYATAIDQGLRLVTKDRRIRSHPQPTPVTVW